MGCWAVLSESRGIAELMCICLIRLFGELNRKKDTKRRVCYLTQIYPYHH
ncbi:rCG37002, partial [Rattus norvegicus]